MDNHKDIATPKRTQDILDKFGLSAKKSLGQNFIIDTNILQNIVKAANIDEKTNVMEVGPGIGALTEQLARAAKKVVAFEIDDRLLPVLEETLAPYDNVTVLHQDVLKAELEQVAEDHFSPSERLVLVANLPYYITTPIIMYFLESGILLDSMTVMMQKEVANRISAAPGTKAYGSLSIAIQYYMEAEIAFTVPKTVFRPMPNVDSAIIHLTRKEKPSVQVKDEPFFFAVVRSSFVQRRKTLRNNLQAAFGKEEDTKGKLEAAFEKSGIDPSRRGETLSIEEFGRLAERLYEEKLTLK